MPSLEIRTAFHEFYPSPFDQLLLGAVPNAVFLCNISRNILWYNHNAAKLWGSEPDLNVVPFKFVRLDGMCIADAESPIGKALRTGKQVHGFEAILERQDGERVRCVINVAPFRDPRGQIVGAVTCLQDTTELTRAREELSSSQERFSALVNQAAVGIAQTDTAGHFILVNDRYCEMVGRTRDELLMLRMQEITHPEDVADNTAHFDRLLRDGAPYVVEERYSRSDGSAVWVNNTVSASRDDGGHPKYLIIISQDITARKHAEQVAHGTQQRFGQLLEALPAAIYTTDAAGRITFYNQAAVEVSGREPQLGSDQWCVSWRLHRPDGTSLPHDECPMAATLKEDRPIRGVEVVAERPDGSRVNLLPYPTPLHDSSGTLVGAVNMLVDITEHKQAEKAVQRLNDTLEQRVEERSQQMTQAFAQLRTSEERFRTLVQGVTDYAILMLDPSGFVANWNAGAARIKGYSAEEIVGRHFSQFYTEHDRQGGVPERALETARWTGKYEAEGWRVRKDGTTFWANVVIDAIHDGAGRLIGFAKITRDLTDRRTAEDELRQAQKMEAIGQLTGGVAHDFNNLLTAIIGNLEMLASLLPAGDPGRRYAEGALRAASRGSRLTEHLLAFSRRQEIRREIVNINELLRETLMLCQKTVGEGIDLDPLLQDDVWPCKIDPVQFGAAVLNLAANARDAMSRSGRLTLRTENATAGGTAGVDLAAGDYVVLSVSDTGCGMSAEVLERAFEPFYTTKEVGKGTGLGLSQVYGFAKQSGGVARIESKVAQGTTVRIYMPRADEGVADKTASKESHAEVPASTATILVVEDDADVREMIVGIMSDLGYRTLVAATGPEALAILRRENSVDLLFTDIVMPAGMSGTELARKASRMCPGLKVLLSSGYTREETQSGPARVEFPFIAKPYRPTTLGKKLKEVLSRGLLAQSAYGKGVSSIA